MHSTTESDEDVFGEIRELAGALGLRTRGYEPVADELPIAGVRDDVRHPNRSRRHVWGAVAAVAVAASVVTALAVVQRPADGSANPEALSATLAMPGTQANPAGGFIPSDATTSSEEMLFGAELSVQLAAPGTLEGLVHAADRVVVVEELRVPVVRTVSRTLKGLSLLRNTDARYRTGPELYPGLGYSGRRLYFLSGERPALIGGGYAETSPGVFDSVSVTTPAVIKRITLADVTLLIRCERSALWPDCPDHTGSQDVADAD